MKKTALLFSIICVGQLYGMEPENPKLRGIEKLTPKAQAVLIDALNTYKDPNDVIKAIDEMSFKIIPVKELNKTVNYVDAIDEMHSDYKRFAQLVHILADKFNLTPYAVAKQFKMSSMATEYIKLADELARATSGNRYNTIAQLIKQGADVNSKPPNDLPLWYLSITNGKVEVTKLLLDNGMDINQKDLRGKNALEFTEDLMQFYITERPGQYNDLVDRLKQIKQLLLEKEAK